MKTIHSSKSFRNKMRKIALRREHDLKFIARRKKLNQTVEYKAIMKRAAIARYNDPDYCKKMQKIWQLRKKVA